LPEQQQVSQGRIMQQPAATRAAQGTAAAALSRAKQKAPQHVPAPADGNSTAAKALASENEKLKAQLVALRQQAADAEESRRMAVLAADNAASERDEYQGQVQELQEQLKEVMVVVFSRGWAQH
jgi:alanyl-tRNA synthetase